MQIVERTPEKMVIRMDANISLANAIRRSVEEVPILAVDEVEFFKNDSALYDEVLAHRIGLVPLKTDSKMTNKTSLDMKLKKVGPVTVYSGDLKGGAEPVFDNIPLTILEKGHEIELVATAKLGKGTDHAKHAPGLCYYRHLAEIKSSPQIDKIVQNSKGLIKAEKKGSSWVCDLTDTEIDDINKLSNGCVQDSNEILFFIESWGQLSAENILKGAISSLGKNLQEFEKSFK